MARESGLVHRVHLGSEAARELSIRKMQAFAALVAAKEREECAKVCNSTAWTASIDEWKAMTKKDVAEQSMHACAAAIRARGKAV